MSLMHFMLCMYIVTDRRRSVILGISQHKNVTKKKGKGESERAHLGALFCLIAAGKTYLLLLLFPGSTPSSFW